LKGKHQKGLIATAVFVILAVAQLYVAVGFASPGTGSKAATSAVQIMGVLTTRDNKAISVNGASAVSGASIPSGAQIVTPDGVGATLRLGALGSLCIAPGSQVTVEFSAGSIKVTVTAGCVILSTNKGTTGTVVTPQGGAGQTSPATNGSIDVCSRPGAPMAVNQGAAADAGAGASALDCGAAGAAAAPPAGIPVGATAAMIGGGAGALYLLFRGGNPSPSGP
jgi:hypothetical protein